MRNTFALMLGLALAATPAFAQHLEVVPIFRTGR